jgi:hypothetical protein
MNRHRYHEHRIPPRSDIRGSLARHVGDAATPPAELRRLVERARTAGVIVFLEEDLRRLPWPTRAVIEGEHKRLGGR